MSLYRAELIYICYELYANCFHVWLLTVDRECRKDGQLCRIFVFWLWRFLSFCASKTSIVLWNVKEIYNSSKSSSLIVAHFRLHCCKTLDLTMPNSAQLVRARQLLLFEEIFSNNKCWKYLASHSCISRSDACRCSRFLIPTFPFRVATFLLMQLSIGSAVYMY